MRRGGIAAVAILGVGVVLAGGWAIRGGDSPDATQSLGPVGPAESGWVVSRVVDGDTLVVTRAGQQERVRLIGIDTPESVRPGAPVECYGPESSAFAEQLLLGREVTLEADPSQGDYDAYDRRLAYVWYSAEPRSPELFNAQAVQSGMAREYTFAEPYQWRAEFLAAEAAAQSAQRGLWGACSP